MDYVNGSLGAAGYAETRDRIINTLMGRPVGHEITPQEHQDFELIFLNYVRSVELVSASTLIGFADENTVPVQPENANCSYISTITNNATIVFNNFPNEYGTPITVTTDGDHAGVIILLRRWDLGYWEYHIVPITLSEIGDISYVVKFHPGFTTNKSVGGIPAGTVIPDNTSVLQVVKNMLYGYIAPTLTISGGSDNEIGLTINPTINFKAVDSSSASIKKMELYKNGTLVQDKDPAVSNTNYSYADSGITSNTTYEVHMYDDKKDFVDDSEHKKSTSVNFYYKYFMGYAEKVGTSEQPVINTSELVRGLTTKSSYVKGVSVSNPITIIGNVNTDAGAYFLVVCVPEGYKITVQNTFGSDYVVNVLPNTVDVKLGGGSSPDTKAYKVYYVGSNPSFKNLKIIPVSN